MELKWKVGNVYKFSHKRKGTFVGQLIEIVPGDDIDPQFLTVKYDVRVGTDQVRLATTPGKNDVRVSNLRPSLILQIEEQEGEHWLREVRVPEEVQPKEKGFISRLFGGRSN